MGAIMFNSYRNYRTVFVLSYTLTILLCNGVKVSFGSEYAKTESPEYYEYLKNIAAVRENHEAKLVEVYKVSRDIFIYLYRKFRDIRTNVLFAVLHIQCGSVELTKTGLTLNQLQTKI